MKMTIGEALEMIGRGETPEDYALRKKQLRRYTNERDDLESALTVLTEPEDGQRRAKKEKRLLKVLRKIEELK